MSETAAETKGQRVVVVKEIVSSRYPSHQRPASWDSRIAGVDVVKTEDGETLNLWSDGGQSPPQPGWKLVLRGAEEGGVSWTLYGVRS